MDGHLMRRGKRMEQLFRHADRDRTGTLDAAQVRTLLRSAKLPERLAQGFMEQVQGSNEPEPMNDGATKVSLDVYEGKVSLDAFSRVLAEAGCPPSPGFGGSKGGKGWDSSAVSISPFSSMPPRPSTVPATRGRDAKGGPRRQHSPPANSQHAPSKHGNWAHEDVPRPMDVEHDTGKAFGNTPYYACDRQVHAWRSYHVQPNPIAMNRAHPGYPPTAPLMSTNYSLSHAGPRDGVGTPDDSGVATRKARRDAQRPQSAMPPSSRPVDPRKARPASAHTSKLSTFCDSDTYNDMRVGFRNVLTGYAGEQREHVVPNATLWTCQLARRQLNTPHGIHDNARTKQEHNFSTEPTSGMKWSGGRNGAGWHVNPVRPVVDPAFLTQK